MCLFMMTTTSTIEHLGGTVKMPATIINKLEELKEKIKCNKCDNCGIENLKDFITSAIMPEIFKINGNDNTLLSIKVGVATNSIITNLLDLESDIFKDMIFAREKFPINAFSAIEFTCTNAANIVLRLSLWLRTLICNNVLCPKVQELFCYQLLEGFETFIPKMKEIDNTLEYLEHFLEESLESKIERAVESSNFRVKDPDDYLLFINSVGNTIYKVTDYIIYAIISHYSCLKTNKLGARTIYVGHPVNGEIKTFISFYLDTPAYDVRKIRVIDKSKLYIVEEFLAERKLEDKVTIC